MIIFKSVTSKNLLSYGNSPTTIDLSEFKNTLIEGVNGSGKSSILTDGICYALYGKPYRSIKLGQLVNSINQRGLEVAVEFTIGSIDYRVVRGMKPGKFEIYKDNVLVDQEAAMKDYQGYLEKQVLKINYKTFVQVVILGTASFIPFMQLNTGQRREVIEDVLDISIFSEMNSILRTRMTETKDAIVSVTSEIDTAKKETVLQQKVIKVIEEARANRIQEEQGEIAILMNDVDLLNKERGKIALTIEEHSKDRPEPVDKAEHATAVRIASRIEDELESLNKRLKNIGALEECPTCMQSVSIYHKHSVTDTLNKIIADTTAEFVRATEIVESFDQRVKEENNFKLLVSNLTAKYNELGNQVHTTTKDIEKRQAIIDNIRQNTDDVSAEKEKLKAIAASAIKLIAQKTALLEEKSIQEVSQNLLKDSGIKAAIIKEYVPILNKLINKYLGIFGFFINFTLDENFVESIVSRGRDEFTYSSFSEGEKRRIDLSILFAFRQISEMKNSANCNLLILDEVAEANFDLIARDAFMEILNGIEGGNNFVISHSAPSHDQYDRVIRVEKKNDFSTIRDV